MAAAFRASPSIQTCEVSGLSVLVPVEDGVGDLDKAFVIDDAVGRTIWDQMAIATDLESIVRAVVEAFHVAPEVARGDTDLFVRQLVEAGLAEEIEC